MAKADTLDLGSWFILRTASADTLPLVNSLKKRGFDVWTPVEKRRAKKPRTRVEYDKELAIMPSYIFANVHHLAELHAMAVIPDQRLPDFSLFQLRGGVPLIDDMQLEALRYEEDRLQAVYERAVRRGKPAPKFSAGKLVHISDGGFAGLSGVVEGQQGQFTLVSFAGFHSPIKIASLLLLDADVRAESEAEYKAA